MNIGSLKVCISRQNPLTFNPNSKRQVDYQKLDEKGKLCLIALYCFLIRLHLDHLILYHDKTFFFAFGTGF